MSTICKVCGMGELVEPDEHSEEMYEQYDPEGFRGNYQCSTCRTTFGSTKSSYTPLNKTVLSIILDELSYPEVRYLQNNDIITIPELKHHCSRGDTVAIGVFIKLFDHNYAKRREAEHTHLMYESIKKHFEEHDFEKCPQMMCRGEWYEKEQIEWLLRMMG